MQLVTAKLSPFAARCRMLIYTKNLDIELVEYPKQISKDSLRARSPMGKVPLLIDGGLELPESEAICEYLEDQYPAMPMRPDDAGERARMRAINRIADLYVFDPLSGLFPHLSRKYRDDTVVNECLTALERGLVALEAMIDSDGYAVGEARSLADCALAPTLLFVVTYLPLFDRDTPLQRFAALERYWAFIQQDRYAARVISEIREGMDEMRRQTSKR